jgi:TetR/AcrR family transcriptional regulator, mexJK operon transcriptional repressor
MMQRASCAHREILHNLRMRLSGPQYSVDGSREPGVKRTQKRSRIDETRVAELLDLAAEAFLTHGFAATNIAEIAQRANASKTTFYSRYKTKEDLFLAALERRLSQVFHEVVAFREGATLEQTLTLFGENLLRVALSQSQLQLIRAVNTESRHHPRLAAKFFAIGPTRGENALAAYLAERVRLGELAGEKPLTMARMYMTLLTGSPIRWFVLDPEARSMPKSAIRRHVRSALQLFLRAYSPQPRTPSRPPRTQQ